MAGDDERAASVPALTRREAMLQLLRVGGIAAGAAGAGVWLSKRSFRPVPAQAEQARRDHRVAGDQNGQTLPLSRAENRARWRRKRLRILAAWGALLAVKTLW